MTEDEMVGWHHQLNGHEFEEAPGVGDGQGSLACCSRKALDMTQQLNNKQQQSKEEENGVKQAERYKHKGSEWEHKNLENYKQLHALLTPCSKFQNGGNERQCSLMRGEQSLPESNIMVRADCITFLELVFFSNQLSLDDIWGF